MAAIRVYTTAWCGYCSGAKRYLTDRKRVLFDEIDLTGDPAGRARLRDQTGRTTVPQIFIGDVHVGGYDDLRALDARGGLDPLLASLGPGERITGTPA
ncbi:MAG TPA: glutaredoxin 3 [Myxococcota bacterium]|nr:glutaredoxin 3 [Myxococcota bacterium]